MLKQIGFALYLFCTKFFQNNRADVRTGFFKCCTLFVCTFVAQIVFTNIAFAQSVSAPNNVSALIYSTSAAELFWTPSQSTETQTPHRVQIKRNGELLGALDARSLFQPGLSSNQQYNYELRSIDARGQLSDAVMLSLSTQNFSLPIKRVAASQPQTEQILTNGDLPSNNETVVVNEDPATLTPDNPADVIVQESNNCIARDLSSLQHCVRNANAYARIDIAQNISCGNNCCPNGGALLQFNHVQNLTVDGHGMRLLRQDNQRQCSLLDINNATNVAVNNVYLDDDQQASGCQVEQNCARMVHIRHSSNISFNNSHIAHGKGYAFYVQGTNGFTFENSSLTNSGVLGMYIGHSNDASSNIRIAGSTFSDNQTNGLALLGVTGGSVGSNVVANNVFVRNHRLGQWAVLPRFGTGFTGGGQLYVAQASNVTVRDNLVKDGFCDNCFVQQVNRSGVSGIELGLPNRSSLSGVLISNNRVINHDGFGILQNSGSSLSNVQVRNNALLNNTTGNNLNGAAQSGNQVINTQQFDSFENASDLGGRFNSSVTCSSGGTVQRQCGAGSRFGQCAVELKLGSAECGDANAQLVGRVVRTAAGQSIVASGWVQNPTGQWCVVFRDSSGNQLREQCKNIADAQRSAVQSFVGLPDIEATSPANSSTVELRVTHRQQNTAMLLDDLMLSVGN